MSKKLYRSETNRMLAGVCGGIAEYFDLDPTLIHVIWAIAAACGGTGVIAYIACALIIPPKNNVIDV